MFYEICQQQPIMLLALFLNHVLHGSAVLWGLEWLWRASPANWPKPYICTSLPPLFLLSPTFRSCSVSPLSTPAETPLRSSSSLTFLVTSLKMLLKTNPSQPLWLCSVHHTRPPPHVLHSTIAQILSFYPHPWQHCCPRSGPGFASESHGGSPPHSLCRYRSAQCG